MMILKNTRHERFCQLVAAGGEKTEAFCQVYPRARNWKPKCRWNQASAMSAKLAGRIRELQEASAKEAVVTRTEIAELLSRIVMTPVADVNTSAVLAAANLLAKLMGYYDQPKPATEFKFEVDPEIRRRFAEVARGLG